MTVALKGDLPRPKFLCGKLPPSYLKSYSHFPPYHIPSPKSQKEFFFEQNSLRFLKLLRGQIDRIIFRILCDGVLFSFSSSRSSLMSTVIGSSFGSTVIGSSFGSTVIGSSFGSTVIGSSLRSWVILYCLGSLEIRSSLESSVRDSDRFLSCALIFLFPVRRYFLSKKRAIKF